MSFFVISETETFYSCDKKRSVKICDFGFCLLVMLFFALLFCGILCFSVYSAFVEGIGAGAQSFLGGLISWFVLMMLWSFVPIIGQIEIFYFKKDEEDIGHLCTTAAYIDCCGGALVALWLPSQSAILVYYSADCSRFWQVILLKEDFCSSMRKEKFFRIFERNCQLFHLNNPEGREILRQAIEICPPDFNKQAYANYFRNFFEEERWGLHQCLIDDFCLLFEKVAQWCDELGDADGAAWARKRLAAHQTRELRPAAPVTSETS